MCPAESGFQAHLHRYSASVEAAMHQTKKSRVMARIWERDHTVWKSEPTEISDRLGWLNSPQAMEAALPAIDDFVTQVRRDGLKKVLLLGMGGSSLAPEVFARTFGARSGFLELSVLDSTDPAAVLDCAVVHDPSRTLYIVSSKSGGTVETASFFKFFYNQAQHALGRKSVSSRFAAITDPGSGLAETGQALGFRKVFLNDPEVGGRYSALTFFGLVPARLIGLDVERLLSRARRINPDDDWSAVRLGVAMGELALAGRDKLTLITSPELSPFGAWAEQLIAESTGKEGKGILPVNGEAIGSPDSYGDDRFFVCLKLTSDKAIDEQVGALAANGQPVVQLTLDDPYDLGSEFLRWELATAVAGYRLGINPFDQPNVESAKRQARRMWDDYRKSGKLPNSRCTLRENEVEAYAEFPAGSLSEAVSSFFAVADTGAEPRPYVALQAYLQPTAENTEALEDLRRQIAERCKTAVTLGYGPRFLHSTGQLHKGDAGHGLFIQLTADMPRDAEIPDEAGSEDASLTFGVLKTAQALGDRNALQAAGRRVIRFHLKGDPVGGLEELRKAVAAETR